MVSKTNEAANLILKREPKAADQVESSDFLEGRRQRLL